MNWWVKSTKRFVQLKLNYNEHFLILASTITGSVSISAFASLLDIHIGITSSAIGLKICATAPAIKKYKSIIKKKKKHDKIVLLINSKLNSIVVLKKLIKFLFTIFNKLTILFTFEIEQLKIRKHLILNGCKVTFYIK